MDTSIRPLRRTDLSEEERAHGEQVVLSWLPFHTYPGRDDNQNKLHDFLEDMESKGLVVRRTLAPDHVTWDRAS